MIKQLNTEERLYHERQQYGGKGFHLRLLRRGGFPIPETFFPEELHHQQLPDVPYIVRSSAAVEDGIAQTAAGKYRSIRGVRKNELVQRIAEVRKDYEGGSVVIQPDLSQGMQYSGVVYSNLNGEMIIALGKGTNVHAIVQGEGSESEVAIMNGKYALRGPLCNPRMIEKAEHLAQKVECYYGTPLDLEFGIINDSAVVLQARALPNPTDAALKEHEVRRLKKLMQNSKQQGLDEIVLGVGNYREILGDKHATPLSVSTFNYIFAGDGDTVLGAVQLGRNELGYDLGTEIFPWVLVLGGKVYFNFAGDALQFCPQGITREELIPIVNKVYLPLVRGDHALSNYPELRLYIQFPEQAAQVGLNPEPFRELGEKIRRAMREIVMPEHPPRKKGIVQFQTNQECFIAIERVANDVRTGSAREYVKAARLAFFALEDVRTHLEHVQAKEPSMFQKLVETYGRDKPGELRDALVYDESIRSFDVPETEDYKYLGSFELSLPRGFPPVRHFKLGRVIPQEELADLVQTTRRVLEYREKVKFTLFRDYEVLKQAYDALGNLTSLNEELYFLEYAELPLVTQEPTLADYRVSLRKRMQGKDFFPEPFFESDLEKNVRSRQPQEPYLIFGSLPDDNLEVLIGREGCIVESVDQTISIPDETKVVLVPENVRPGSHLFTVLSDYGLPVIALHSTILEKIRDQRVQITTTAKGGISFQIRQ